MTVKYYLKKQAKLIRQVVFFGLVGAGSLLIDLVVTMSLYNYAHFPPGIAGTIGFLSAFFFNFPINRKHVFHHTQRDRFSLKTQAVLYATLSLVNLGMTGGLMQLLVTLELLQIGWAKVVVTGVIAGWNFLLFKFFIFSKKPISADLPTEG
jgi:putative flippase GtrA